MGLLPKLHRAGKAFQGSGKTCPQGTRSAYMQEFSNLMADYGVTHQNVLLERHIALSSVRHSNSHTQMMIQIEGFIFI